MIRRATPIVVAPGARNGRSEADERKQRAPSVRRRVLLSLVALLVIGALLSSGWLLLLQRQAPVEDAALSARFGGHVRRVRSAERRVDRSTSAWRQCLSNVSFELEDNAILVYMWPTAPYRPHEAFVERNTHKCKPGTRPIYFTDRASCEPLADVMVWAADWSSAEFKNRPRARTEPWQERQTWVLLSWETSAHFDGLMASPQFTSGHDYLFVHENGNMLFERALSAPPVLSFSERSRGALILTSSGHSRCRRTELLEKLVALAAQAGLPVESIGKVAHNTDWPLDAIDGARDASGWGDAKQALLTRYKFEIIVANSLCDNYLDEKIVYALQQGAIPVYLGAPNAVSERAFEPFDNSTGIHDAIIYIANFDTITDLLNYLKHLIANPEEAERYHEWRRHLPDDQILRRWPRSAAYHSLQCQYAVLAGTRRTHQESITCHGDYDNFVKAV